MLGGSTSSSYPRDPPRISGCRKVIVYTGSLNFLTRWKTLFEGKRLYSVKTYIKKQSMNTTTTVARIWYRLVIDAL